MKRSKIRGFAVGAPPLSRSDRVGNQIFKKLLDLERMKREVEPYTPTGKGLVCVSGLAVRPMSVSKRPCNSDIKPVYQ